MKRKKPAPAPKAVAIEREEPPVWLVPLQAALFTALLFLAMTVQTGRMSVVLPVLALALSVGQGPLRRLRERFCVPVVGFAAFALACGLAAIYAAFGAYAVKEYYKFIASFSVSVLLLTRFDRRHVRSLLWGLAAVCALLSLLCTDAGSGGPLYGPFCEFVESLGGSFAGAEPGVWGQRVNGIYNDANITAGILALGAFCGLHLTLTGKRRWERLAACLLTGMSGLGFVLAMSRGAILCFGLALLVYLAAVGNGERTRLFFLIVLNVLVTAALSMPVSRVTAAGTLLPDAGTLLCGLPVWLLYDFPGLWTARKLEGHGRVLAAAAAALVLGAVIYGVAAIRTTGPYVFSADARLFRTVELQPGAYTLMVEAEGESFRAYMSQEGGEWNALTPEGDGPMLKYAFTADQAGPVSFLFNGEEGDTLRSAVLSDGMEIPLGYPLLPSVLAERMGEDLFESISFTYRVQYDKDGWVLFKRAPLLGKGLGSTEGLLTSVQPFFYESLFLHNHVLQVLCDCGLLGGVPFLAFLLGSVWLLLRRLREARKEGGDPLAAALLGCWVMMNAHGLMELNFSIRAYQCVAYPLLLLSAVLYGKPIVKEKALQVAGLSLNGALCVYLGVFVFGLELHRMVERQVRDYAVESAAAFMEQTRKWVRMDWFDKEQNMLNFVGNATLLEDPQYEEDMARYVKALRASGTYSACTGLAEYYYLPRGELDEVFKASREGVAQEASSADAWNQQVDFYRSAVLPATGAEGMDAFLDGVQALADYLEAYNRGRQEEIVLRDENRDFLERAETCRRDGLKDGAALLYMLMPYTAPEPEVS